MITGGKSIELPESHNLITTRDFTKEGSFVNFKLKGLMLFSVQLFFVQSSERRSVKKIEIVQP
jgi:hypothetical protein